MNLLSIAHPAKPYLLALARTAGKAILGLLLIGLAAGTVRAQESDNSALTNALDAMVLAQSNAATMQVEDLVSALRSVQPEEAMPGQEAEATNGVPDTASNEGKSGNAGPDQSYRRPSGRESRSRWSSRQRTNRFGSDASSGPAKAPTATNAAPVSLDYEAFRIVAQRNIFDPNRRPNHVVPSDSQPSRDPIYFALVGTMSYEEGTFAFFSGSSSFYQKAAKCADTIGGYTVTKVTADSVTLAHDTNQVELHIGMQMRQDDNGTWTPLEAPTTYTVNDFQPASNSTASAAGPAPSGEQNEILKRLMEKREKE